MKRKVVEQGGLTLMVSLPRKWAQNYNLKRGDEIDIQESGKNLILSTNKAIEHKKQTIQLQEAKDFMGRLIQGPYRLGADVLEIQYKEPKILQQIKQYLENTMGFEIIDQKPNLVTIEMVAKESPEEFDKVLKRIFLIIQDMSQEIYLAITNKDETKLDEVLELDQLVNRLTNFAERMLNKHGYKEYHKTSFIYCTVWSLEQVADRLTSITTSLKENSKVSKLTLESLKDLYEYIKKFYNLFYSEKLDKKELNNFKKLFNQIEQATLTAKNNQEKNISISINASADLLRHLSLFLFE